MAPLFELERFTLTSMATFVACVTMIDSIKNCLPRSLSVLGRQCLMASQGEAVFRNRIRRDMMLAMRGAWGLAATTIQGDVFLVIVL